MDVYLNVEFENEIDDGLLHIIANELTFAGIRVPIRYNTNVKDLLKQCSDQYLKLILLIPDEEQHENQEEALIEEVTRVRDLIKETNYTHKLCVEVVNEPQVFNEFWRENPKQLGHAFNRCIDILQTLPNVKVLSPSIKNLGSVDINYLSKIFSTIDKDKIFSVSVHRYPAFLGDWYAVHKDYPSRDAEIEALKQVIGRKEFLLTEIGCSQNYKEKKVFCDRITNLTEKEQTDYFKREMIYWRSKNVPLVVWYQINDGPDNKEKEDGFGIRRFDNTPKHLWHHLPQLITIAHKQ